jgi:hypothetical protein
MIKIIGMRKIGFLLLATSFFLAARSQEKMNLILSPTSKTILPGEQLAIEIWEQNRDGIPVKKSNFGGSVIWKINGNDLNALNPEEGELKLNQMIFTNVTYLAPPHAPQRNPVAISAYVQEEGNKSVSILVCNVTILDPEYKITADFEADEPKAGLKYHFRAEAYTNMIQLDDGTYKLEPVDKSDQMDLTVEEAFMTSHSDYIAPKKYRIPFLFTIDKLGKDKNASAGARIAFNTICPQKGKVLWDFKGSQDVLYTCNIDEGMVSYEPGTSQVIPAAAGNPFAMSGLTYLDLFQYFGPGQVISNANENVSNGYDLTALFTRIEAHKNDQAYFKTAQGQSDLQQLKTYQKKSGSTYQPHNSGEAALLGASEHSGLPSNEKSPKARMLPGMARLRVEDVFHSGEPTAFTGELVGNIAPIHSKIVVKVQKIK